MKVNHIVLRNRSRRWSKEEDEACSNLRQTTKYRSAFLSYSREANSLSFSG